MCADPACARRSGQRLAGVGCFRENCPGRHGVGRVLDREKGSRGKERSYQELIALNHVAYICCHRVRPFATLKIIPVSLETLSGGSLSTLPENPFPVGET